MCEPCGSRGPSRARLGPDDGEAGERTSAAGGWRPSAAARCSPRAATWGAAVAVKGAALRLDRPRMVRGGWCARRGVTCSQVRCAPRFDAVADDERRVRSGRALYGPRRRGPPSVGRYSPSGLGFCGLRDAARPTAPGAPRQLRPGARRQAAARVVRVARPIDRLRAHAHARLAQVRRGRVRGPPQLQALIDRGGQHPIDRQLGRSLSSRPRACRRVRLRERHRPARPPQRASSRCTVDRSRPSRCARRPRRCGPPRATTR